MKKPGAPKGNKNATKAAAEKVAGVGRLTIDLGDLKLRLKAHCQAKGLKLKEFVVDAIEARLGE